MNAFKTLSILAFLIVILGAAVMYRASLTQKVVDVQAVESPADEAPAVDTTLASGTYLVYSITRVSDPGTQDWANDDVQEVSFYRWRVGDAAPVKFYTHTHGLELDGSLTTYVFGRDLLMHRFALQDGKQQDGLVNLAGDILEVKPEQWGVIRSANGKFEVAYTSPYDNIGVEGWTLGNVIATVTDLQTGVTLATVDLSALPQQESFFVEPFIMDDSGKYFYAHELCGCEAQTSGLWEVEVATGAIRQLDTMVKLDNWGQASIDPENRRMLFAKTDFKNVEFEIGPGRLGIAPTYVGVLDLDTGIDRELFTDEDSAYGAPLVDPTDSDRYLLVGGEENLVLSLRSLSDPSFKEDKSIDGTAHLTDFLGNAAVYLKGMEEYVLDWESDESTLLGKIGWEPEDGPWQKFDYVGSVTIQ